MNWKVTQDFPIILPTILLLGFVLILQCETSMCFTISKKVRGVVNCPKISLGTLSKSSSLLATKQFDASTTALGEVRRQSKGIHKPKGQVLSFESKTQIFIGNIEWNISQEIIAETIKNLLSKTYNTCKIVIKPKSNKKRDVDKKHGGSLILIFDDEVNASIAMNTLLSQSHYQSKLNPRAKLNIRWVIQKEGENIQDQSQDQKKKEKQLQEQVLLEHRQQRALKYQRQRQRIAAKTDELIDLISPHFIPKSIETLDWLLQNKESYLQQSSIIDWSTVPYQIDPMRGGKLRKYSDRGYRKQAQVEAFVYVLQYALIEEYINASSNQTHNKVIKVADLGCGAGNLSIPLAWSLNNLRGNQTENRLINSANNDVKVVAVDINKRALDQLDERAKNVGLDIETVEEDLLNLIDVSSSSLAKSVEGPTNSTLSSLLESCSAVVSLHACGAASDLAIMAAVSHSLPFCISPCCIGKAKSVRNMNNLPSLASERSGIPDGVIAYPRSNFLVSTLEEITHSDSNGINIDDYSLILNAADYSMGGGQGEGSITSTTAMMATNNSNNEKSKFTRESNNSSLSENEMKYYRRGRMAKVIVETDRLKWAEEHGYNVRLMELPRLGATYPKREVLLGAKKGSIAALRISNLPFSSSSQLRAKVQDDDSEEIIFEEMNDKGMIDEMERNMNGFTNYLVPYAIALISSLVVTAAFVKFVLIDY
jgi:SAM-dependent methyltransferase